MQLIKKIHLLKQSELFPWIMCAVAALFYCYEFFLRVSPSVIIGTLMQRYHIDAAEFGILSSSYYYTYTPMQLLVGPLMDMHGVRRILTGAALLCAIGTYLFISTDIFWIAEIGRFLMGFASAFAFVGVLKLASEWLPPKRLALVSGFTTTLGMLGAISGQALLTKIISQIGWKGSFHLSIALGFLLTLLIALVIRDKEPNTEIRLKVAELKDIFNKISIIIGNPQIWLAGIIGSLLFMPTSVFAVLWGIPYLHQALHIPIQNAANMMTMIFIGWAIGSPILPWISNQLSNRKTPLIISSLCVTILITILIYIPPIHSIYLMYGLLLAFGVVSSAQVLVFPLACEHAPRKLAGTAVAVTNMTVTLGGAIFPPIVGFLLDHTWTGMLSQQGFRLYGSTSYKIGLSLLPIGLFLGFLISFLLRDTYGEQQGGNTTGVSH